jgi:hypothetical protein
VQELTRQSAMVRAMLTTAATAWEAQHLPTTAAAVSKQTVTVLPLLPWRDPAVPELLQEELLHRFVARHGSRWSVETAAGVTTAVDADTTSDTAAAACNDEGSDGISALTATAAAATLSTIALATIAQLARTDEQRQWRVDIGRGLCVCRRGDTLVLQSISSATVAIAAAATAATEHNSVSYDSADGLVVQQQLDDVSIVAQREWSVTATRLHNSSDSSSSSSTSTGSSSSEAGVVLYNIPIGAQITVRCRREGDVFCPPWRDKPVKVKDFLRGQGVPWQRRSDVALITVHSNAFESADSSSSSSSSTTAESDDTSSSSASSSDSSSSGSDSEVVVAVYPSHIAAVVNTDTTGLPPVLLHCDGATLYAVGPRSDKQPP